MRRGLGTKDDAEADRLVEQMDRLLRDESFWNPGSQDRALRELDPTVVAIFYDDMVPSVADSWMLRESCIPLPGPELGYTRVQLLGPTGAGKTTLVRQVIGADPRNDRFPSTSTAKTTVFDIEIVLSEAPYRAVVSFASRDRTRNYIAECVSAAISAAAEKARPDVVARRFLEHSEQRFRLSYLLGTVRESPTPGNEDVTDEDAPADLSGEPPEITDDERTELDDRLNAYLQRIADVADTARSELAKHFELDVDATLRPTDRDAFLELLEDTLRDNELVQALVDDVLDDVETRFALLTTGVLETDTSGWPSRWIFDSSDRAEFIRTINRFSSNYAPNFGRLLTPLVDGLRASGPFKPDWYSAETPKLVLMDGEGIGHTPDSATSLSTAVTRRYERCDAIVLVDSSTQPMVAGSIAVLRSIAASGYDAKLIVVFTQFDRVTGDNLPTESSKRDHVLASLDNAVRSIDEALASGIGRGLRRRLDGRIFFVGGIDVPLVPRRKATRLQLQQLLSVLAAMTVPPPGIASVPVYDLANLVVGTAVAARQFQDSWDTRLPSEHWTRVKALTRRLGYWGEDEYDTLKPVADLIRLLSEQIWAFIATPREWKPTKPSEEDHQAAVNRVAREFFGRLHTAVSSRLWSNQMREWQAAFDLRGRGSGNRRRHSLKSIYDAAAPIPGASPVPEATEFIDAVRNLFKEAVDAAGGEIF